MNRGGFAAPVLPQGGLGPAIGRAVAIVIPLALVYVAVLNNFYSSGDMLDPVWLASIAWHSDFGQHAPPAMPVSFFTSHVSPIFWLPNLVSYVLPLSKIDYFGLWYGGIYALYSAGIYKAWLLNRPKAASGLAVLGEVPLAVVVGLAATFSAFPMQALRLPHYELALPAFALWFLITLVEGRYRWAILWFALCLMVREDAGLHLFAVLFLWGAAWRFTSTFYARPWPRARYVWAFAAAALAYAIFAVLLKNFVIQADNLFTRLYVGTPPWHHITGELLLERLRFYALERTWITVPLLVTMGWAAISRNPLLPLGYIAFLPWLLLNFQATHVTPGTLGYYYGFPFWLALAWPLIALHLWPQLGQRPPRRWPYLLVLAASLAGWQYDRVVVYPLQKGFFDKYPFAITSELLHRHNYEEFVGYFAAHEKEFARSGVDLAVFGLVMDHVTRRNWLEEQKLTDPPEILIYFTGGFEWPIHVVPLLATGFYGHFYQVPGTRIELAAHAPLDTLVPGPSPFVPEASPLF